MVKVTLNDNYSILIDGYSVGTPSLYTKQIQIPGRNGVLDYSNAITGGPTYFNRTVSFTFNIIGNGSSRDNVFYTFYNQFYGQDVKAAFDNLDGYFKGKITSIVRKTELLKSVVTVSIDCYPYRILDEGSEIL